jgi:hypothetical protein
MLMVLPQKSDCLARLASLPSEIVAAVLVAESLVTGDNPASPVPVYLDVIEYCNLGRLAWLTLERIIRAATHINNWTLAAAVRLGRRDLPDEFEERYLTLRSQPYDVELAENKRREEEEREANEKRYQVEQEKKDRAIADALEQLDKAEIALETSKRRLSRGALEKMRRSIENYLAEIHSIYKSEFGGEIAEGVNPWIVIQDVTDRAKVILQQYYPAVCREFVVTKKIEHLDSLAKALNAALNNVINHIEIDLMNLDTLGKSEAGKLPSEYPVQLRQIQSNIRMLVVCSFATLALNALLMGMIWIFGKELLGR